MKAINKIFIGLGVAVAATAFSACTGDLDVPVQNPNQLTPAEFSKDPKGYLDRCMAEIYQGLATAGNGGAGSSILGEGSGGAGEGTFTRTIFTLEELTTDNFSWLQFNDAGFYELVTQNFAPDNQVMYQTYSRIYAEIALCNQFIRTVNSGAFALPEDLVATAEDYIRQAKVVRSLAYFYAIDLFGDCGYVDESAAAGSAPPQVTRQEAYETVVKTLEDVSAEWGDNYSEPAYGYVGKEVADAILVKFYLNAATWGINDPQAYQKCWNLAGKIIANHRGEGLDGTGLAESYLALFGANNHEYAPRGTRANEIIMTVPQDGTQLESYGGSTFYIASVCGSSPGISSVNDCNLAAQWTCMVARQQLSEMFAWTPDGTALDKRAAIWKTKKDGFRIDNSIIEGNDGYAKGYAPLKYTNFAYNTDGTVDAASSPANTMAFSDADWVVIRLAEIYLSAAEAYVLGNAGNASDALIYVNNIRGRAGLTGWDPSDLTADNLLAERNRELYGENDRRTALVRHGKYAGSNYIWNWKGGVQHGAGTPTYMNLFPIPDKVISFSGYRQNDGYRR